MHILVACEMSGKVREAFRLRGHDAISADLLPSRLPGPHYQGDVRDLLSQEWDMIIAFPPCTYLSAARGVPGYVSHPEEFKEALAFLRMFLDHPCERVAVENPVGHVTKFYRKYDQLIQPYHFGHPVSKRTCIWVEGTSASCAYARSLSVLHNGSI